MLGRLALVIFDCDGVLIDSELLACRAVAECLAEGGIDLTSDEILQRYTGISWVDMLADLTVRHGPMRPDFAELYRARQRSLFKAELAASPGIDAVLDALRCKVCIASSGRPDRLRYALGLVGLYQHFAPNIFSAVEVARGKPAPDLFLHAAARMGVAPASCIVIEDSLPGVAAAVAAGMPVIGFTGASHCRPGHAELLKRAGAVRVIERMSELLPILAER